MLHTSCQVCASNPTAADWCTAAMRVGSSAVNQANASPASAARSGVTPGCGAGSVIGSRYGSKTFAAAYALCR